MCASSYDMIGEVWLGKEVVVRARRELEEIYIEVAKERACGGGRRTRCEGFVVAN